MPPIVPIPAIPRDKDRDQPSPDQKRKENEDQTELQKGPDEPGKGDHIDGYA